MPGEYYMYEDPEEERRAGPGLLDWLGGKFSEGWEEGLEDIRGAGRALGRGWPTSREEVIESLKDWHQLSELMKKTGRMEPLYGPGEEIISGPEGEPHLIGTPPITPEPEDLAEWYAVDPFMGPRGVPPKPGRKLKPKVAPKKKAPPVRKREILKEREVIPEISRRPLPALPGPGMAGYPSEVYGILPPKEEEIPAWKRFLGVGTPTGFPPWLAEFLMGFSLGGPAQARTVMPFLTMYTQMQAATTKKKQQRIANLQRLYEFKVQNNIPLSWEDRRRMREYDPSIAKKQLVEEEVPMRYNYSTKKWMTDEEVAKSPTIDPEDLGPIRMVRKKKYDWIVKSHKGPEALAVETAKAERAGRQYKIKAWERDMVELYGKDIVESPYFKVMKQRFLDTGSPPTAQRVNTAVGFVIIDPITKKVIHSYRDPGKRNLAQEEEYQKKLIDYRAKAQIAARQAGRRPVDIFDQLTDENAQINMAYDRRLQPYRDAMITALDEEREAIQKQMAAIEFERNTMLQVAWEQYVPRMGKKWEKRIPKPGEGKARPTTEESEAKALIKAGQRY